MYKVAITNVVVSKGYEDTPALKFSENGECVRFRIGIAFYDADAENNTRWLNKSVKAFGSVCERLKKAGVKEGSHINVSGNNSFETWTDKDGKKQSAEVLILTDFDYPYSSSGDKGEKKDKESKEESEKSSSEEKTGGKASVAEQSKNKGVETFNMGPNPFFSGC